MQLMNITDRDGLTYLMYNKKYQRFDVRGMRLCFDNDELCDPYKRFDTVEIDTRFCVLINSSVGCHLDFINNLLAYICNNQKVVKNFLYDFLSDEEIDRFLEQIRPSILGRNIEGSKQYPVYDDDDIPRFSNNTARKRFFILNENNHYIEVGLATAISVYGRDVIIEKCRELDYLNGIGMNGRAMWLNGLGIQDIDRDHICGGWCR